MKDIFENKTVALVGPAKYLEQEQYGEEIDSHDIVVRVNRGAELVGKYASQIGSRTDVMYSCLIEQAANAGVIDIDKWKQFGIEAVITPPMSDMKGNSQGTKIHHMADPRRVRELKKKFKFRVIDSFLANELAKSVKCRPNTGYLAIFDILRFKPKQLSIYGFSFYLDDFMEGTKSGIEIQKGVTQKEFSLMAFNSKRHVQKNLWQFAKTLKMNDVVRVDEYLKFILDMNSLDREEFKKFCDRRRG